MPNTCQEYTRGRCWTWQCAPCASLKRLIISRNLRAVLDNHPALRVCWWLPKAATDVEALTDAWRRFKMAVRKTEGFPDHYVWALSYSDTLALYVTATRRFSEGVFRHYWEGLYDGGSVDTWRATPDEIEQHWCRHLGCIGPYEYMGERYGTSRALPALGPRQTEAGQPREDPPEVASSREAWRSD